MSVQGITSQCWILALFIRDDGERLLLGDGAYEFNKKQQHFAANDFENDTVDVQGADGTLLAGQVRRAATQSFDGYIGDAAIEKAQVEQYRLNFLSFFRKNFFYKVVYIFPDGSSIQRQRGFIVDAPEVQELWQVHPEYHVALNFEDVNYYSYDENAKGEEIYGQSVEIPLSTASKGGMVWDGVGLTWDGVGAVWEVGAGGTNKVIVGSITNVYPILVITGPTSNPTIENITTGGALSYDGNITESQTLRIDMSNQTATLNGASVLQNVSGDWLSFAPGENTVAYSASNTDAPNAHIEWNEVVG